MLLDDIMALAADEKGSISSILRKCLILAYEISNERLKRWANSELNGYEHGAALPDYRLCSASAKGNFSGPLGAQWTNFLIPPRVLEEKHRGFAKQVSLRQTISAYEHLVKIAQPSGTISFAWPPDLCLYYQERIPTARGMMLLSAYQEVPKSALVELLDTVRNRVLTLTLEIRSDLRGEKMVNLSPQTESNIDHAITQHIYGGTIYVATGHSTMQFSSQSVQIGD